jgi:hypothetical protein
VVRTDVNVVDFLPTVDPSVDPSGYPCGFPVLINGTLTSITLDFGDRKIVLLPGANVTLTRADENEKPIGEPLRIVIPGPELDQGPFNNGTPAIFTATGC